MLGVARTDTNPADRVAVLQVEQRRDDRHRPLDEVQREHAIPCRQRVRVSVVGTVHLLRRSADLGTGARLGRRGQRDDRRPSLCARRAGRVIGHGGARGGCDRRRISTPSQWSRATRIALRVRPAFPPCVRRWSTEKTARLQTARRTIAFAAREPAPGARGRTGPPPASATSARPSREVSACPASMSTLHRCLCLAIGKNRAARRPTRDRRAAA
jgi:hypothetical protein